MIRLDYRNTDANIIGNDNGLNIQEEFAKYKDAIAHIISDLNKRKDKKEKRKYGFTSDYSGRPGPLSLCQCLF